MNNSLGEIQVTITKINKLKLEKGRGQHHTYNTLIKVTTLVINSQISPEQATYIFSIVLHVY